MDDKLKRMSFKDFTVVNPSMTDDEYLAYQAQKRRRGHFDTQGESVEHVNEKKVHINLDDRSSPRQDKVVDILKSYEKKGHIKHAGNTDKGSIFDVLKPASLSAINKELKKVGGGYNLEESVEQVDEVMSISQRKKAGQRMKRMSKRIQVAKKRAMKRAPTMDVLQKRAQKTARSQMIKKWSRGQDKSDMSAGRRGEMEKRLKKSKGKIDRMAKKLVPQLRKVDRERRSSSNSPTDKK